MISEALRPELDIAGMPERMRKLPVHRGFPVPWFVSLDPNGVPEFRAMDRDRWRRALNFDLCWVCGETLGRHRVFVIGPMCGINRTTSEPPCHADCAEWSARNCPFLSRPDMERRDMTGLLASGAFLDDAAGCPLHRNPGVALLWWTRKYSTFRTDGIAAPGNRAGTLIELGEPERVRWFCKGRAATRAEVIASIEGGLPSLREMADAELTPWRRADAHKEIDSRLVAYSALYPDE